MVILITLILTGIHIVNINNLFLCSIIFIDVFIKDLSLQRKDIFNYFYFSIFSLIVFILSYLHGNIQTPNDIFTITLGILTLILSTISYYVFYRIGKFILEKIKGK